MSEDVKITDIARVGQGATKKATLFSSRPAAGFPSPGDDQVEKTLDLNDLMVEHPESTFYVRVSGDSMEGRGIYDGDILVVDRAEEPRDGSVVVAAVFGELVVKTLEKKAAGVQLVSAQAGYAPISITDNDECYIWGVVTGSVRGF